MITLTVKKISSSLITISTTFNKNNKPTQTRISFPESICRNLLWRHKDKIQVTFDPKDGFALAERAEDGQTIYKNKSGSGYIRFPYHPSVSVERQLSGYKIKDGTVEFEIQPNKQ